MKESLKIFVIFSVPAVPAVAVLKRTLNSRHRITIKRNREAFEGA
jgi:hypothetical protein